MNLVKGLIKKIQPEEEAKSSPVRKKKPAAGKHPSKKKSDKKPRKKTPAKPGKKTAKAAPKKTAKKKAAKTAAAGKRTKKTSARVPAAKKEKEIGRITHYFARISVGIIKLRATLKVGDRIRISGSTGEFTQKVSSMQIFHESVSSAGKGREAGLKVKRRVHENDRVYLIPD